MMSLPPRETAWTLLCEYTLSDSLRKHALGVEAVMRAYAHHYASDADRWGMVGLLHDFDWEIHPTLDEHPQKGSAILRERGVSEEVIQDILSHADHTGVPRDTLRRKAIAACDEVTGLITAVALVRPSRSLYDLEASSVKKKWKDKAFAAGTDRTEMEQAAKELSMLRTSSRPCERSRPSWTWPAIYKPDPMQLEMK